MNAVSDFRRPPAPGRQRGVALVVALIFLLLLTLVGVANMGNSMLEERMAGNLQAQTQAFQAAETGVVRIIAGEDFGTSDSCTDPGNFISQGNVGTGASVKACRNFLQALQPAREAIAQGAETLSFNHFRIPSVGETQTHASTTVVQGVRILGPSQEGVFTATGRDQ